MLRYQTKRTILGIALALAGLSLLISTIAGADYDGAPVVGERQRISVPFPTPPTEEAVPPAETPIPIPQSVPDVSADDPLLRIVDAAHPVTDEPPELCEVEGITVAAEIAEPLEAMLRAARGAGHSAFLCSGYRDAEMQKTLYLRAENGADNLNAAPENEDEHRTGLCCDITDVYRPEKHLSLADTDTLRWLARHCHEFGFILRYPEGAEELTGRSFEPWHFRYVGTDSAAYIAAYGLCLEQYISQLEQ